MFGWILNWMEYNRGLFKTNIGQLGLSEILLLISLIHVVTGLAGQEISYKLIKTVLTVLKQTSPRLFKWRRLLKF